MDLNKEEILKKEKKIRKEIKENYLEESYINLKNIHDYIFQEKLMLIFGKNIDKIEEINFTIYFLAKTFIYLIEMKEVFCVELKDFLKDNILLISINLYDLWTKLIAFYSHKICRHFLLYRETKDFFESHVIQSGNGNDFKIYEEFFTKDIKYKLNGQDKIAFCYASRLFDKKDDLLNNNKKEENESDKNKIENDNTIPIIVSKEKKTLFYLIN